MQIISASNLEKTFTDNTNAIKKINFSIFSGKITGIVGPDGAGKTTLIRMLTGLLAPTFGELKVLNYNMPNTSSDFLQQIGYMPQKFGLYEDLTVYENLKLYSDLQNIENSNSRIDELLTFTSLKKFQDRLAGKLSGGMKQKLGLACALIKKPKLLLLDEPGVGVDPISRIELWEIVQKLLEDDIAVIWSTSYLDEAQNCDEVILLNEGNCLYQGTPQNLKENMKDRVFLISGIFLQKRETLTKILEQDEILDAVLVGSKIRINLKKNTTLSKEFIYKLGENVKIEAIEPIFEDCFVDILNIKTKAHSQLVENMKNIEKSSLKLIEAKSLTKKFGNFIATDNIDFEIGNGEIFGFLGPNGAGKSTTFKMLCGLLTPTFGTAKVLGEDLYKSNSNIKNSIGYMAQKFSLYGNLKIKDNLDFFSGIYGLKNKKREEKIEEMIEIFDFKNYLHLNANSLPLGIKQRLSLACSVMHEPKVLFLDEPTSGVDPITRKEFWTHINGMVKKGVSIMVTTHFMDEAEYCDKIMLIYKGKNIASGTPDELKALVGPNASMQDAFITLVKKYDKEDL
ncbi:ATP-binding cassette domain-containing protein [Aliarcobacter cryaerophilus]|jgi:ABC-2 type transport system ATP-binding protein|uniref:Multidrug ABC transporter ATP-binding protein n=1 Tax=Aliarcobacter cryaerophilus TaxID=28198 RepID=A0A1V9VE85_9BACT|nr:ATP-binding cassette domain-containing protein [Aliarcobacter cryaerophilus]OQA76018.1 MAG: putative ABC transporter ATP-binding protein YbhF [Candidatus Dependentiae bacterium ADurb.Bin246]TXH78445.1 MAG: ABC transporter ATP-binding protein [Romboutsia sp.]MCT7470147.1 ATP-binding cassette domain-containing protein [Aliarcobacter cryaerophilus]MCT7496401.1 ATP-binding cassette domain-containing protein [Aliarcobacter cryaerophilus]OQR42244.1 multidrug ABC transporter ATP-binding protein [A